MITRKRKFWSRSGIQNVIIIAFVYFVTFTAKDKDNELPFLISNNIFADRTTILYIFQCLIHKQMH